MKTIYNNQKGSLLLEILLAVLIAAIVIGAAASLGYVGLRSGQSSGAKSSAVSLAQEGLEAMQSIAESDWHNIYLPPAGGGLSSDKGEAHPYYIYKSGSSWAMSSDIAKRDIIVGDNTYSRTIYIYNVNRASSGDREIVSSGGIEDPSTQRVKVIVSRAGEADVGASEYLTRWKNSISAQSNWSGGAGQGGPIATPNGRYDSDDGNIDTGTAGSIQLKQ